MLNKMFGGWSLAQLAELFRPPDIHLGGLMFYQGFFFYPLLSFFFRRLISELAEWNSRQLATWSEVSAV